MLVLLFSDISWRGLHQRPHHIARAIARHHPVLWVEPMTLAEQRHWRPVQVEHNIFAISLPSLPYNARHGFVRLMAKLFGWFTGVRHLVHDFDIHHFINILKPVRVLEETDRRANVVTVTSPVLEQQIQVYRNEAVFYIGNGVEFYFFYRKTQEHESPPDLPTNKPIVGYVGAIYPWLDYDAIEIVAECL